MPKCPRGRPAERVIVSPSERTTWEQWSRRRTTAQGLAQRARIILAAVSGASDLAIAAELSRTSQVVARIGLIEGLIAQREVGRDVPKQRIGQRRPVEE
jgi:hypothetical protein